MTYHPLFHALLLCILLPQTTWAQTEHHPYQIWNEEYDNTTLNLRHDNGNPTALSYNPIGNAGVARISYKSNGGGFRSPQQARRTNDINVYIGGLKQVGRFSMSGHINYLNRQEKDRRWNATLYLTPSNPFILADSVHSNYTTESFDMQAAASYIVSDKWKVGADIRFILGAASDQTDPRPKIDASVIPVTLGADYQLTKRWNIGFIAGVRLYQSNINYTLIDALIPYQYILMRGMGDYQRFSTSQMTAYERNYKGQTYHTGIQTVFQSASGRMANHLALHYRQGSERARDGGSAYNYRGGDYRINALSVSDKLQWKPVTNIIHTFTLAAHYQWGEGTWYDQKLQTDAEHGNIIYYTTLGQYKIHDDTSLQLQASYRLDRRTKDNRPDLSVTLGGDFLADQTGHVTTQSKVQQHIRRILTHIEAEKLFHIRSYTFTAALNGALNIPMNSRFGNGNTRAQVEDIAQSYTYPLYAYTAGGYWLAGTHLAARHALNTSVSLGLYISADYRHYTGSDVLLKKQHYTQVETGLFLQF